MLKRITGIIGWVGTGIVFAAVAVRILAYFGMLVVSPERERWLTWMPWAGLVCILLYVVGQWREIAQFFRQRQWREIAQFFRQRQWRDIVQFFRHRQARLGTAATLSVLIVLGILVAINYIASRENKRWDLTAGATYSLTGETATLLSRLDAPLRMLVFTRQSEFARYRPRLSKYEDASKKISVRYVDPEKNPTVAREKEIKAFPVIVLEYKGRTEQIVSDAERDVANGLIKVMTGQQKKVYFVEGHGEHDPTQTDLTGYAGIASVLTQENYSSDKLTLTQTGVPADAAVVVVAGPTIDYLPNEVDALRSYLRKGGKLLLLVDPPKKVDSAPLTTLLALAREWDIAVGSDVVIDESAYLMSALFPVVQPPYPPSPITDGFRYQTAFPFVSSVAPIAGGVDGRNAQTFVQTGPASRTVGDVRQMLAAKETALPRFDEKRGDKKGPISIAAAVSAAPAEMPATPAATDQEPAAKPESRLAVIGNSDFVANSRVGLGGNRDLFLNAVSWLAQREYLISLRPREPEDRRITMTTSQQFVVAMLALLFVPVLCIASGIYTWWRRR
jgi:ABC-type uncharacterized transport system involved in gliding motility auxiliary subunit